MIKKGDLVTIWTLVDQKNDLAVILSELQTELVVHDIVQNNAGRIESLLLGYRTEGEKLINVGWYKESELRKVLSKEEFNKLSPRERLVYCGYAEDILVQMVRDSPAEEHDRIYEDELSCAE
jgi:hypothetical protein